MLTFIKNYWRLFTTTHPLLRGSITYAVLWPTGSLIQQSLEGKNFKNYDYVRMLKYSLFGSLYVAPSLYGWVKISTAMWPQMTLRIGLTKALIEQISYGPFSCVSFFVGMSLLEGKTVQDAIEEAKHKFWPTYRVGMCIWPILQTVNFSMVPEKNRIVFVSICSLLWTTFLAFMKRAEIQNSVIDYQSNRVQTKPLPQHVEFRE
uniref:Mpv17-like protein n=1 Tax=Glossina brevipalpis TaxID=37001 RepID=A0A1A9X1D3_9MUSC